MQARVEIAKSIFVYIKSDLSLFSTKKDDTFSKQLDYDVKESTKLDLSELEKVKQECINDTCYVALKFTNLPLLAKIKKHLSDSVCECTEENKYLLATPLFKEFKEYFGCYPSFKFYNVGSAVFIEKNGKTFYLPQNEFLKLFTEVENKYFSLIPTKKILKRGDIYHLRFNINRDGYLSVYQVSQNGGVSLLIDNEYVQKEMELIYPEKDKYEGIEAFLSGDVNREIDLTIAALCNEKINNNFFSKISNEKQVSNGGFESLVKMIGNCDINSKIIEIWR